MWFPIKSKYANKSAKDIKNEKQKQNAYSEQVADIEKQLAQLIVQMIDDDAETQATALLRLALKKVQIALRFLR